MAMSEERRKYIKDNGLCRACGKSCDRKDSITFYSYCNSCRHKHAEAKKNNRINNKCGRCGNPCSERNDGTFYYYCDKHRQALSVWYEYRTLKAKEIKGNKCVCCNHSHIPFLQFDHVHNDGKLDREENGMNQQAIVKYILETGDPEGRYQLLCGDCNLRKYISGTGQCDCGIKVSVIEDKRYDTLLFDLLNNKDFPEMSISNEMSQ